MLIPTKELFQITVVSILSDEKWIYSIKGFHVVTRMLTAKSESRMNLSSVLQITPSKQNKNMGIYNIHQMYLMPLKNVN